MVRAKFQCVVSKTSEDGTKEFILDVVIQGSKENGNFFKQTPSGHINLGVVNPDVNFELGKEYYVDFTEAE